jgi:tRNA(adenine34) deaminase
MKKFEPYIKIAIDEAKESLREGNHGFGAVIILNGEIISQSHDKEVTLKDPTFHAELDVIRLASKKLNGKLNGCSIISTHEPCPMCATAILWSGISEVIFGYSIADSIKEGRKRINIKCSEIFERADSKIKVIEGVLKNECSLLYNKDVRKSIKQLRNIDSEKLKILSQELSHKRKDWFIKNGSNFLDDNKNILENAYEIFLNKLGIKKNEVPIVEKNKNRIIIHSINFCSTLEACKILNLDTRYVCKNLNEEATDVLLKEVNQKLKFSRNYNKLRPFSEYCEKEIHIVSGDTA